MKRASFVLAVCALTACCASEVPLVGSAAIADVESSYVSAQAEELRYLDRDICTSIVVKVPCSDPVVAFEMRRADYDAAAAIVTMQQVRTANAVAEAQRKTQRLRTLVNGQ